MKTTLSLSVLLLLPAILSSQLKVEWQKELDIPGSGLEAITGLILDQRQNLCVVANQSGTKVFGFNNNSQPVEIYSIPFYVWWVEPYLDNFFARENNCLNLHNFNSGAVLETNCYQMPPAWATTSPVSKIYNNSFYYAGNYFLCKFKKNGEVVFKKEVAESGNSNFIHAGGGYIYLYGRYNTLSDTRLMQYDTLGNQKWSIAAGGMVSNILADEDGNCYVLSANGESTIIKYDTEGKVIWSKLLTGQYAINGSLRGDSLLLCGNISLNAITDKNQSCAYSIMSVKTGEILSQQVVDLYEDINEKEMMTQIAGDGKNIYIGGTHGKMGGVTCFLIKLSKEGATGINEETKHKTFNIFPNPSGSKFTISSEEQGVQSLKVTVRNSLGQVVQKETLSSTDKKNYELDLGKHAAGNYTIEIESGKDKVVKKVVVE